jgi:hypothetical protein
VIAGAGCVAVLVSLVIFREDLIIRYELHRLRSEEGYLLEALQQSDGTAVRKAARLYLESREGLDALLGLFLASEVSPPQSRGAEKTSVVRRSRDLGFYRPAGPIDRSRSRSERGRWFSPISNGLERASLNSCRLFTRFWLNRGLASFQSGPSAAVQWETSA